MASYSLVQCPYNKFHSVRKTRMWGHLEKCRRGYVVASQAKGEEPMEVTCKYNPKHKMFPPELLSHEKTCSDRHCVVFTLLDYEDENKLEQTVLYMTEGVLSLDCYNKNKTVVPRKESSTDKKCDLDTEKEENDDESSTCEPKRLDAQEVSLKRKKSEWDYDEIAVYGNPHVSEKYTLGSVTKTPVGFFEAMSKWRSWNRNYRKTVGEKSNGTNNLVEQEECEEEEQKPVGLNRYEWEVNPEYGPSRYFREDKNGDDENDPLIKRFPFLAVSKGQSRKY